MGSIKTHPKVKTFAAITVNEVSNLSRIISDLTPLFGQVDLQSDWFGVDLFTHYYRNEMGSNLQKIFVSFKPLAAVEDLPRFKINTNKLEDSFLVKQRRTVNIDPGYLTEAKVVLATTKDFSHRLYLGHGIFGDLHLVYRDGTYQAQSWTYPDYQQELAISFFSQLRSVYKQQVTKS